MAAELIAKLLEQADADVREAQLHVDGIATDLERDLEIVKARVNVGKDVNAASMFIPGKVNGLLRWTALLTERMNRAAVLRKAETVCDCGHSKIENHGPGGCYVRVHRDGHKWCPCELDWGQTEMPKSDGEVKQDD